MRSFVSGYMQERQWSEIATSLHHVQMHAPSTTHTGGSLLDKFIRLGQTSGERRVGGRTRRNDKRVRCRREQ
jgi:hypothetical protein